MARVDPCRVVSTNVVTGADPRPLSGTPGGDKLGPANYYTQGGAAYNSEKYERLDGFYKNYRGVTIGKSLEFYLANARAYSVNAGFSAAKRAQWDQTAKQLDALVGDSGSVTKTVWALIDNKQLDICTPLVNPIHGPSPFGVARSSPPKSGKGSTPITNVNDPKKTYKRYHNGIDYHTLKNGLGINQPCYAIADGEVIMSGLLGSAGLTVRVHHGFGITSRYLHLGAIKVKKGDKVKKGQILGLCGDSEGGRDERGKPVAIHGKGFPHLHFEIRINVGTFESPPTWSKSLNSDTYNFPIDPGPLLVGALMPGEAPPSTEEVAKLARGRDALLGAVRAPIGTDGNGAALSPSRDMISKTMTYYEQVSASMRAEALTAMNRKQVYAAAAASSDAKEAAVAARTQLPIGITPR